MFDQSESTPRVSITRCPAAYPDFPFNPSQPYPEYRGPLSPDPNQVYESVRESFRLLGYDRVHFGSKEWNPLGHLIHPDDRVFIKPNLVAHEYRKSSGVDGSLYAVITHPSVVRAVADYAAIALHGTGEILIGDNPSIDADFEKIAEVTGLRHFEEFYEKLFGVRTRVLDLRRRRTDDLKYYGFRSKTVDQPGDPDGSTVINLGRKSYFTGVNPILFRGVFTDRWETIKHHHGTRQEYSISNSILKSDVYISVPKLKAHHKVGATLNVKGLVGINDNKNYLVHWKVGFPITGGDEYPAAHRKIDPVILLARQLLLDILPESWYLHLRKILSKSRLAKKLDIKRLSTNESFRGAWDGNDTIWRMAADLYNVFLADRTGWRKGNMQPLRTLSVVDGIVGGEGNGPFTPTAKESGVIVTGENLLAVDCVASRLMDFDWTQIRYLTALCSEHQLVPEDIAILSTEFSESGFFNRENKYLDFVPPHGWNKLSLHQAKGTSNEDHHTRGRERRTPHAADKKYAQVAS